MTMVIYFFTESIGKTSEAPHVHPHREVLALYVTRAYIFMLGIADDRLHISADAAGRTITPNLFFVGSAVQLVQHRIVNVHSKRAFHGFQVRLVRIRGELNARGDAGCNILHEFSGPQRIALSHKIGNNKLRLRVHRDPRPKIADAEATLRCGNVLGFRITEAPNLIAFDATGMYLAYALVVVAFARCAEIAQQFFNCHTRNARNSRRAAQTVAFHQRRHYSRPLFCAQPVHTVQYTCSCMYCQGEKYVSPISEISAKALTDNLLLALNSVHKQELRLTALEQALEEEQPAFYKSYQRKLKALQDQGNGANLLASMQKLKDVLQE